MKKISTLLLLLLMASTGIVNAQIKNLKDLKPNTPYLLRCVNDYGYCIYNPAIDEMYPTLGEAIVDHPSGCANDAYHNPIDPRDKNNQWYIESDGNGNYKLKNAGNGSCISNETVNQMGGWWGGGNSAYITYGAYFFTEMYTELSIEPHGDGIWMFRPKDAVNSNTDTAYLCAASHSNTAIANWKPEDAGSNWEILTVEDDIRLYHQESDVIGGDDNQEGLGDVTADGDIRYFCFRDSQLIVIPDQFILDREEDEQFLTLKLYGDTTITMSKYALLQETTEAPFDLPTIESFKFNNKFNDQLYTDAEGIINNETNAITVAASSIGKNLTASIKLPDEEDQLGTKVWVEGKRNISKETRRRFDRDYTYIVARPRQYIYKVKKIKNEQWSTAPEDTEEPWIISPVELTGEMISTNWPSADHNQALVNILDGNTDTYFHSNWSSTNDWSEGAYYGDGKTTWPYLQIEMAEPLENFQFSYTTRKDNSNGGYAPQGFIIMGSNDGKAWDEVATLDKERDQMPTGGGVSYTSPIIQLGKSYDFLRLQLTASTRKNYLVISEFTMNKAAVNPDYGKNTEDFVPELISPAVYQASFEPYGRNYNVHVDFPTDITTSEYNVPRIDIWFGDSVSWSSKMWIGRYGKEHYENAAIQIDGAGVYPDMPRTEMQIRGRGNSSWSGSWSSKNPYRLKFNEKVKPFGMTKGKSWVLLANKQSNSMTTNAIAMKIADMVESAGCNHIIPADLYINGQYRGSYNFTEKTGFSNNSLDLADDSKAAMIELDSYYDETYKFRDESYNLYVNIKEPDLDEMSSDSASIIYKQVQDAFNNFTSAVRSGYYATNNAASSPLDVQGFVRAWLVTDLTRNTEIQHPKSWNVYTEDYTDYRSTWHFGPVWDFDWSYGYEGHSTYFIADAEADILRYGNVGTPFFRQLVQGSDVVKKEYYRLWTHFINDGRLDELINYCDDYFAYVEPSFIHNATVHGDGYNYATTTANAKSWLTKRANYIYKNLTVYDLKEDIIEDWEDWGQPDGELDAEKPEEGGDIEDPDDKDAILINMAMFDKPMDIYSMSGQKIATLRPTEVNPRNLRPGIYIINGKKVAIK